METTIKHLEFIQGIIARISTNSFVLKGWTITICAGLIALSESLTIKISFITIFLLVIFWALDGYYRSLEKRYRALYDDVRVQPSSDFNLDLTNYTGLKFNIIRCMLSMGLLMFHGGLIILFCVYLKFS